MSIDLDALIDQAFSGDDAMADALLNHLRASPDAALFLKLLGSERASLRHAALQYLEHCPHPDVLLAAAKLVNDPEEEVREALAEALQKLSAWQAGDLVERLLTDQAPGVRCAAVLAALRRPALHNFLCKCLETDEYWGGSATDRQGAGCLC